jgi:uncharacterized YigZ family protein
MKENPIFKIFFSIKDYVIILLVIKMKSIKKSIENEIIINKSTFINFLVPVSSVEEANIYMSLLRRKYKDASHHCFAYIIGDNQQIQKFSDDGEPSKTAGMPMLEVLKKHELTNILNVSVRYFGGIKLGAGGLVRAYTKSCSESVKRAEFSFLRTFTELEVIVSFNEIGHVEKYIRDHYVLINTTYDQLVHYFVEIETIDIKCFSQSINDYTNGSASVKEIKTYSTYK